VPISDALREFSAWFLDKNGYRKIWANGIDFDIPILAAAYTACNLEKPWKFYNARDVRTALD